MSLSVFPLLPPLEWRGRKYPVTSRDVSFAHDGVRHRLQYRDFEFIDQLGAHELTFTYTIPMRQGIARGPYVNLFTEGLPILFGDCLNRDRGELFDPVYGGPFNCKPQSYRDTSDVNKRDGTDVTVEFIRTVESGETDELPGAPSLSGVVSSAQALEQSLGESQEFAQIIGIDQEADILSAVAGAGAQFDRQGQKVSAALGDLANRMDKLDKQCEKSENPQTWGTQSAARRVRDSALRLKERGDNPAQRIVTTATNATQTISAIANDSGMTLVELLRMNPALARSPMVPAGTMVRRRLVAS